MRAKIDHAVTCGTLCPDARTFDLENDARTFDLENNVWALGDVTECVALDVSHDVPTIQVVHPGHGSDTTIGTETPDLQGWIARGH